MQLVLELKHLSDLEILLPLLRRLDIGIIQLPEKNTAPKLTDKPPLAKHIGALPAINTSTFEKYLDETRNEWERPIS